MQGIHPDERATVLPEPPRDRLHVADVTRTPVLAAPHRVEVRRDTEPALAMQPQLRWRTSLRHDDEALRGRPLQAVGMERNAEIVIPERRPHRKLELHPPRGAAVRHATPLPGDFLFRHQRQPPRNLRRLRARHAYPHRGERPAPLSHHANGRDPFASLLSAQLPQRPARSFLRADVIAHRGEQALPCFVRGLPKGHPGLVEIRLDDAQPGRQRAEQRALDRLVHP